MTKTKHKHLVRVFAALLAMAMCLLSVRAWAAEKSCRIRVSAGTDDAANLLAEAGAVADLYLIATSLSEGRYELPGGLDLPMDQDKWRDMAQSEALKRAGVEMPVVTGMGLGAWTDHGDDGDALENGLYLLVVRPNDRSTDYLKTFEDEDGGTYVASEIKSKGVSVRISPEIIAMPGKAVPEDGSANAADPGEWIYDVDVTVKTEAVQELGSIEIIKDLLTYEKGHDAFFLFQVEGYLNGEHVYSNLVAIRFDTYGEKSVVLDNIPVGTEVTVTEAYATPGYELVSTVPSDGKLTVSADEVLSVRFENDYSGTRDKGGGIMNSFDYDLERGEWSWTQE